MAYLYTDQEKREVLRILKIDPIDGRISGKEAGRILTWRAAEEAGIIHEYDAASLRRHVQQGNIVAQSATQLTEKGLSRKNFYRVDEIFLLSIEPRRGRKRGQHNETAGYT